MRYGTTWTLTLPDGTVATGATEPTCTTADEAIAQAMAALPDNFGLVRFDLTYAFESARVAS